MRAWGYTLAGWRAETPQDRARLIAHEWHRNIRSSWETVQMRKYGERKTPAASGTPFDNLRKQFFG